MAISLLEIILSVLVFGLHYGWLDDIIAQLRVRGLIVSVPADGDFYNIVQSIWGPAYVRLFEFWPNFDWYAAGHLIIISIAVFNINYIIDWTLRRVKNPFVFPIISLVFYFAFVVENVFLLNGTRIPMMTTGSCMLAITILLHQGWASNKKLIIFQGMVLFMAFIMRFSVAQLMMCLLALFAVFFLCRHHSPGRAIILAASISIFLISFNLLHRSSLNEEEAAWAKTHKHLLTLLDGFNGLQYYEVEDEVLQVKRLALTHWYFGDYDQLFDPDVLESFGPSGSVRIHNLRKWRDNLSEEIFKSRHAYQIDYQRSRNWYWKNVLLLCLIACCLVVHSISGKSLRSKLCLIISTTGIIIALLSITILFKMEDRILHPILIMLALGGGLYLSELDSSDLKRNRIRLGLTTTALLLCGIVIVSSAANFTLAREMKQDYHNKLDLFSRMDDAFKDQYVFFDLYTYSTYPGKPFKLYQLKYPDKRLSYIEPWNNISIKHRATLQSICPNINMPEFFSCMANMSENEQVVFFYNQERVDMLEKYMEVIYDQSFSFTKIPIDPGISYSYLWFPIDMAFYSLQKLDAK